MINAQFIVLSFLVFGLVFGLTASCKPHAMERNLVNTKAILTGLSLQFLLLPFFGFISVSMFKKLLPDEQIIMLLLVTTSPGGNLSNFWNSVFNAELGLSLTMTSVSSLLSLLFIPVNLLFYTYAVSHESGSGVIEDIDWLALFITVLVIISAVASGYFLSLKAQNKSYTDTVHMICHKIGSLFGLICVIYTLRENNKASSGHSFYSQAGYFYVAILFPIVIIGSSAIIITSFLQLPKPECVALTVEACMQNVAIGVNVSFAMYGDDEEALGNALSVLIFYAMAQGLISITYCIAAWKIGWTKAPASDPFFKDTFHSYKKWMRVLKIPTVV